MMKMLRSLWYFLVPPADEAIAAREAVLRRGRRELQGFIRRHEGRSLGRMRLFISTNCFAGIPEVDQAEELGALASTLTAYARECAQERGLASPTRLEVHTLSTVADIVTVQRVRHAPSPTTALLPQRITTGSVAGATASTRPSATTAVFSAPDALVPGGELLLRDGMAIGRIASEGVAVLGSNRISARHATISIAAGEVSIADEASTNGSFVNSERLEPHVARRLTVGEVVTLADIALRLEALR